MSHGSTKHELEEKKEVSVLDIYYIKSLAYDYILIDEMG